MKLRSLLACFFLFSLSLLIGEGESISFDDLDEEENIKDQSDHPSLIDYRGLQFSLYTDFTIYGGADESNDSKGEKVWDPYFEFGQNHFIVLGAVSYENLSAQFDLSTSTDLLEVTMSGERGTLSVGRIFIPFGEANYHHIYGGFPDDSSVFLPFFWIDYGIKSTWDINEIIQLGAGITNGFRIESDEPVFTSSPVEEQNLMKALNLQVRLFPTLSTMGSFSFMYDSYNEEDKKTLEDTVLMYGTDWRQRLGRLTVKAGVVFIQVNGADIDDYYRYGWYGEGSFAFSHLTLRLRAGGIDPDSRFLNEDDALNINGGFLIPMGPLEWQTIYLHNIPRGAAGLDEQTGLSHQVMAKLLIRL